MTEQQAEQILAGQRRIERKLDQLLQALAESDEPDEPQHTLDGERMPGERDQTLGLG